MMGHAPPRGSGNVPSTEDFHIGMARASFLAGRLTLGEFEASVEHVLSGGYLDCMGRPSTRPLPRDPTKTERR
jgi:hypothetical protein